MFKIVQYLRQASPIVSALEQFNVHRNPENPLIVTSICPSLDTPLSEARNQVFRMLRGWKTRSTPGSVFKVTGQSLTGTPFKLEDKDVQSGGSF